MSKGIIMSQKEINRIGILKDVIEKRITKKEASQLLEISYRQTKRLAKKFKEGGEMALIHKNRGKPSPKKTPPKIESEVIKIYEKRYWDFKPTFFSEKLQENHDIHLSREKIRQILITNDLWKPRRKNKKVCHVWRERKHHYGEMIQIDGSHHKWLEDRFDQVICLMGYIDDATGEFFGRFYEYEGTFPALDSFKDFVEEKGIPFSIYIDRHSTYKTTRKASIEEDLRGEGPQTQFERVMKELGVKVIHARSPQAKGRVERIFETLQDRLVKEMRLAKINSISAANIFLKSYLPKFNQKFAIKSCSEVSCFKELPKNLDMKWTFAFQDQGTIGNNYTIRWQNRLFLLENPVLSLRRCKVRIKQAIDGDLRFETKDKRLVLNEITNKDARITETIRRNGIKYKERLSYGSSKNEWFDKFYIGQKDVKLVK
jgi:transposase